MVWGWFVPCFFVMAVALSMAELVSSMPYVVIVIVVLGCISD